MDAGNIRLPNLLPARLPTRSCHAVRERQEGWGRGEIVERLCLFCSVLYAAAATGDDVLLLLGLSHRVEQGLSGSAHSNCPSGQSYLFVACAVDASLVGLSARCCEGAARTEERVIHAVRHP